jgi:hypothetical protein
MVQWMKDRDLLVAETLDLLKNAVGESKQAISAERIESPTTEPSRAAIALPTFDRSEVKARLARFKATQTKFQREGVLHRDDGKGPCDAMAGRYDLEITVNEAGYCQR